MEYQIAYTVQEFGSCNNGPNFSQKLEQIEPMFAKSAAAKIKKSFPQDLNLAGVFAPLTTPFDSSGNLDVGALRANIIQYEIISKTPKLSGYVVMGTTGEYPFLSTSEKVNMVKTIKREIAGSKSLLIAGTGCQSTADTIELTNQMASLGANAALVYAPSCYKDDVARNHNLLISHFTAIADGSLIPIIIYNMPQSMGAIDIGLNVLSKLASMKHPKIIGLKECNNDLIKLTLLRQQIIDQNLTNFQVLTGSASMLYPALITECAVGGICALADVLPGQLCQLHKTPTEPSHRALLRANEGTLKKFGIPGIKAAMDLMGFVGGHCRSPLTSLNDKDRASLKALYQDLGFVR